MSSEAIAVGKSARSVRGVPRLRARILAAGEDLYAQRSVKAITVEDIVSHADVSRRTFYRHFRNGNDLFHVLVAQHFDGLTRFVYASISGAADPLATYVDDYTGWWLRARDLARRIHQEAYRDADLVVQYRRFRDRVANRLAQAHVEAEQRIAEPMVYRSLVAAFDQAVNELPNEPWPRREEAERCRQAFRLLFAATLGEAYSDLG